MRVPNAAMRSGSAAQSTCGVGFRLGAAPRKIALDAAAHKLALLLAFRVNGVDDSSGSNADDEQGE